MRAAVRDQLSPVYPTFPCKLPLHNRFKCLIQVILKAFSSLGQVGHVPVPLCDLNQL
jgi:hypothetical protein